MSPPNASLILIMVCFWVTFWLVQRFLIRPIWGVVSERKGRIDSVQPGTPRCTWVFLRQLRPGQHLRDPNKLLKSMRVW